MSAKRTATTLYLDPKVVKRARELGLNVSKVCERALIQHIKILEKGLGIEQESE